MPDRETLDVDVLVVGGGPAGMSAALRLSQLQKADGGSPLAVAVLEKSREPGAHVLSGAVLDPSALQDLVPDFRDKGAPLAAAVRDDAVYVLTPTGQFRLPITPPPLRNHGHYVVSLSRFVKWLAGQVEAAGVDVFTGFGGAAVLYDGDRVAGVRTGDRGVDRQGRPKAAFEPGVDVRAKVTIFCDGVRGNLTKQVVGRFGLDTGRQPQVFALGIKELWEVPRGRLAAGSVLHTMGHPLRMEEFGGGFVYASSDELLSVGFVAGLDYKDPMFDPHAAYQRFKQHRLIEALLDGGKMIRYGAKALPEGGWYAIPRVHMDGALIAGDAAGFLNSMRLKGIHLAMRTGMLAAEAAFDAVRAGDVSAGRLERYQRAIDAGDVRRELYPVRNVHQAFAHGLPAGVLYSGLALVTGGWWIRDPMPSDGGYRRMEMLAQVLSGGAAGARCGAARQAPEDRPPAHVRQADERAFLGHAAHRGSAVAPHRARHGHLPDPVPPGVRQSMPPLLPGERLRDGGRRHGRPETAHQRLQLRALQDVRHHGSVSDHRLGAARGRGGTPVRRHVTLTRAQRVQAAAIAAVGTPIIDFLGASYHWRERGVEHLRAIEREGRRPIFAFWHGRILAATLYFRDRGIIVITSENFDGEWIARIIQRFGYGTARGSTSRGGVRALVQLRRDMACGRPVAFTVDGPRGPAGVAQPGALWLAGATGNPIVPFHIEAAKCWVAKSWDRHQIPKLGSEVAIAIGSALEVPGTDEPTIETARVELEQALWRLERQAKMLLVRSV